MMINNSNKTERELGACLIRANVLALRIQNATYGPEMLAMLKENRELAAKVAALREQLKTTE